MVTQVRDELRNHKHEEAGWAAAVARKPKGPREGTWLQSQGHPVEAGTMVAVSGAGQGGPSNRSWGHRREKLPEAETEGPTVLDFPELQGFLRCGTFSAETRRDLDKLGPVGHPGTRRKRQKTFPGFSLPLSSLSPASTSHGLDRVGSHFGKYLAGVRPPARQSKAGKKLGTDLRVTRPRTGTAT